MLYRQAFRDVLATPILSFHPRIALTNGLETVKFSITNISPYLALNSSPSNTIPSLIKWPKKSVIIREETYNMSSETSSLKTRVQNVINRPFNMDSM